MRRDLFIGLLLAGLTLAAFWPVGQLGFIRYDDEGPQGYIVDNPNIQAGITPASVCWAFTTAQACNWHPVTWLSHMLDCQMFGLNAGGHHWTSLGFHVANTLLLFIVLRRMLAFRPAATPQSKIETGNAVRPASAPPTATTWVSALVAALFAVHPLHLQSVAWISERKDVLSGFFFFLILLTWVRYVQGTENREPGGKTPNFDESRVNIQHSTVNIQWYYWTAVLFFALGLMSKPMLVTLPVILLLLDFWPLGRVTRLRCASAWQAGGGWRMTRWGFPIPQLLGAAERSEDGSTLNPQLATLLWEKLPFAALSLASGIITLWAQDKGGAVADLNNAPLHLRLENVPVAYVTYLEKLFWPANLAIFYPFAAIHPWKFVGSGLLLIGLSAVCLWRVRSQPYLLAGWGWFVVMLLPVIGLLQVGLQSMADRYTYLPSIGVFIMVAGGMAGVAALSKLWRAGTALAAAGLVLAGLVDTRHQLHFWRDSVSLSRHVVEVSGPNCLANSFLAGALWAAGDLDGAARNYQYVVRVGPDFEEGHYYLGRVLLLQKKPGEAQTQFGEVLRLDPNNPFALKFMGDCLSAQGKFADAEVEYQAASQLKPGDPVIETALEKNLFLKTLQLQPDSADVLNNLAWLLATCPDNNIRDGVQAVRHAEHACELTHYRETMMVGTLAAAYAEAGRFEEAVATAQKACALASASGQPELLQKNQELLERYRRRQPYRDAASAPPPAPSATNPFSGNAPQ